MNSLPCIVSRDADNHARKLDAIDRAVADGWMMVGERTSTPKWVRDTIGFIAERHWVAIADAIADYDECEAGRLLKHAIERHAIDSVRKDYGIDLRTAEYTVEGVEP